MADRGNGTDTTPPSAGAAPAEDTFDLRARLDRFGDLLGKGLDLAEAGLSLGLTVASTLGAVAQQKIFEKVMEAAVPDASAVPASGGPPAPAPAPPQDASPAIGITNRLPLAPGMPVRISFSINNDNATAPKHVALTVEPFTGERTGALLAPASLSVTPAEAAIAPMDFEKFVLVGTLTESTPADIYHGSIAVESGGLMRIPVLLVVNA